MSSGWGAVCGAEVVDTRGPGKGLAAAPGPWRAAEESSAVKAGPVVSDDYGDVVRRSKPLLHKAEREKKLQELRQRP